MKKTHSTPVLDCDFTLTVHAPGSTFHLHSVFTARQEPLVLFGPSGSGKSLTLAALAGLARPQTGHLQVRGQTFLHSEKKIYIPARKRQIGMVFQEYALFPHLNVRDNVCFGLQPVFGKLSRADHERVNSLLDLFGLQALAHLRPQQISGGQRQRTALARALAKSPQMLLLDEPFSALDQPLRAHMRHELHQILEQVGIPMVLVSHDFADIDYFAQTLVLFQHGQTVSTLDYTALKKEQSLQERMDFLYAQTFSQTSCKSSKLYTPSRI